jgi:uncharacterized RDD family membrane protein YckC
VLKSIDIRTTQNVTITYEHAFIRERILAFILDYVFLFIGMGILYFILDSLGLDGQVGEIIDALVIGVIVTFYTLILESTNNGQTIGKKLLRIKVVKLDGKRPDFFDYLLRWTLRLIDIWASAGTLACILISSNRNSQRLGEIVSNTIVVRVKPRTQITLEEILKIDDRLSYVPVYPEIRNFREDDILVIKQSIERYHKYRNNAHREALVELCEVLRLRLQLPSVPPNKMEFLKTCIKDYIVMTR